MTRLPILSLLLGCSLLPLRGAEPVQVDLTALLNARVVTTVTADHLVPWRDGVDNAGSGLATAAAAARMGNGNLRALPDDGCFPADARHPAVQLHFSNADGKGNQVHRSTGADEYAFALPAGRYRSVALYCMSGMGPSHLVVTLTYADGSHDERTLDAPDWWNPSPAGHSTCFDLAANLGKWDDHNRLMEPDHHYLVGLELQPDPAKTLVRVSVAKTAAGVLTLWGATAVATGS